MRNVHHAWLLAAIGLVALLRFFVGYPALGGTDSDGRANGSAASAEATALLGGLAEGEELAAWKVDRVEGPSNGAVRVWVAKGEVRWAVELWRAGSGPGRPPRSTQSYDLYYGNVSPRGARVDQSEMFAVLDALVDRVKKVEHVVPPPAGM